MIRVTFSVFSMWNYCLYSGLCFYEVVFVILHNQMDVVVVKWSPKPYNVLKVGLDCSIKLIQPSTDPIHHATPSSHDTGIKPPQPTFKPPTG